MQADPAKVPPPILELRVGDVVWFRSALLPRTNAIITLVAGLMVGGEMGMELLIGKKAAWTWVWLMGLAASCVQVGLALVSLVAWSWQKPRLLKSAP